MSESVSQDMHFPESSRGTAKTRGFTFVLAASFLLVLVVVLYVTTQFRSIAVRVSPETTFLTEPLHGDGLPDYVEYLHQQIMKGVTPENNGAVPFWQAAGSNAISPEQRAWYFEQLGMPVPEERDPAFDIDTAAAEQILATGEHSEDVYEVAGKLLSRPWRRSELPGLADWLDAHADDFTLLQLATSRERFACPAPEASGQCSVVELTWPHLMVLRDMLRNLSGRAMLRMGEGDMEAAWSDCRTMFQLSNGVEPHSLIGWLMRISAYEITLQTTAALLEVDSDAQRLLAIEAFIGKLSPVGDAREMVETFERIMYLSAVVDLSRNRFGFEELTGSKRESIRGMDWNQVLRRGNEAFDALAKTMEGDRQLQADKLEKWEAEFIIRLEEIGVVERVRRGATLNGRARTCSDILIALMIPATLRAADAKRNLELRVQQSRLQARLNAYRCEQQQFPASLDSLNADPTLLVDPVNKMPLNYQRTDNGFLLYSFGVNGQDEQGCNEREKQYRGVYVPNLNSLLSESELVDLEQRLSVPRTEWTDRHVEALVVGDDIATRSPIIFAE